ncbi:S-adenosylmethionine decarboxylase proenzyme (TIGR03330) [uncultured phage_MedDCM-OCT-S35-C6]|jgi:S-adenosylmethionine/arginine decarboxylase-like enzyme|uniref:S-adenosylmethionine decarboxylase proenzyme (TIGR03330) n=1 Tax=uncultured phage_MedDCM-OCT-S35-C6 TaxID=2741075 RepID=A0A6S4P9N6_9CAUD|nr:S-adenosylmethionine decarboxylase proenzyme (TIGR03330) [uncultured phage_MedDCM-OCT-S35-C6]BAQ94145.1 S-adenosylmethionine decarboxylase proenzyme (TIGR03330) [uncultured phage_MedDCM-OCT-S35-C6]|tara:strand:- start:1704 stop:2072 length:369 start_codon:yes stop_codon:yes gene_type:complete
MLEHKHIIIRASVKKPPKEPEVMKKWIRNLVEKLNMTPLGDTIAVYVNKEGNRGLTCLQAIDTSHIAFHSWDEDTPAVVQLDVYTCSDLKKQTVFDALDEFEPIGINYMTLDRKYHLEVTHI